MKKIFRFLATLGMTLLFTVNLISQDREPYPLTVTFHRNGHLDTLRPDNVVQEHFFIGHQWGGHFNMSSALRMNTNADGSSNYTGKTMYLIPSGWEYNPNDDGQVKPSFLYEPTLYLPKDSVNKFWIRRPYDNTNPIWGFSHVRGTILTDSGNVNYGRLILDNSWKDSVVLKDP